MSEDLLRSLTASSKVLQLAHEDALDADRADIAALVKEAATLVAKAIGKSTRRLEVVS